MEKINIQEIAWEEQRSPSGKYHSFLRNVSLALGGKRDVGTWGGGHPFDLQVRRVPPGAAVCPLHAHTVQFELFVVIAGEATVRVGDARYRVGAGEVFAQAPGTAHQMINEGAVDYIYHVIADNPRACSTYYPDSNKWALKPQRKLFRMHEVDYFDGEDPAAPPPSGGVIAGPGAGTSEFKPLRIDALAWDAWRSPKGKFEGASKELSIALGAKRNTPPGLGGHPFDLELNRLAPGACGVPYHSHAAQWEMFIIVSGHGTVRSPGAAATAVGPDDVVLHPPGEAHQLTNTGTEELLFYILADNPPGDIYYYPDSDTWGGRPINQYFRLQQVEYWSMAE